MPQNNLFFQTQGPSGAYVPQTGDAQGAVWNTQRHGKYYAGAYAKVGAQSATGWAANQAAVTTSAGLATTYVGICLSNPAASGKNLVVQKVSALITVVPAAFTGLGLITGYLAAGITVHTTPLTPATAMIGGAATNLVGLVDAACTLVGTPVWKQWIGQTPTATSSPSQVVYDVDGEIILIPGAYMAIGTTVASPTSGFWGTIAWEELNQ